MLLNIVIAIVTLSYPAAVYFGLQHFEPRVITCLLLVLAAVRFFSLKDNPFNHWAWPPIILLLALWTLTSNSDTGLRLYPVLVSLSFLIVFAWSLKSGPPVVERLARISEPELPPSAIEYTRRVTIAWCVFFTLNASVAGYTVWLGNSEIWALYNGLISYLLMASLFAIEWLIRQVVRSRAND